MSRLPTQAPRRRGDDSGALLGTMVGGKYRLLRLLGRGGMGTVFKAENTAIGKIVALKLLHPTLADDGVAIQRFQREARAAVSVGHPNIVDIVDLGQEPGKPPFIVMEYVRGKSLKKLLKMEGPLDPMRAVRIAGQVLDALTGTHARGIVHRDLKPENVLITSRYGEPHFVKVFDFGISTFVDSMADKEHASDLTPTGFTMATPYYASPEQVRGEKGRDPRVDIYAVGVILYEMLTGNRPFQGANLPELCQRILAGEPAPFCVFRKDIPHGLEAVARRALAERTHARYQNASDMLWALVTFGAAPPRSAEPEPTDTFVGDLRDLRARESAMRTSLRARILSAEAEAHHPARLELATGLIGYFEGRFGVQGVRDAIGALPQPLRLPAAVEPFAPCSPGALGAILDGLDREFGRGDRAQVAEAGRHFLRTCYHTGQRIDMFKRMTPEVFFSMVSDIWNRYFAVGDARVIKVGRGYGRLEVRAQPAPVLANSVAMLGIIEEGLRLAGANEVSVRLAQAAAVGDERDLFEATWSG